MTSSNYQILPSTFRRRISIMRANTLQDAAGGIGTSGYVTDYTTWASVVSLSANRKTYYGMDLTANAWEIVMRYTADRPIQVNTVIQYGTTKLIVQSSQLQTQDYKTFWVLVCKESNVE